MRQLFPSPAARLRLVALGAVLFLLAAFSSFGQQAPAKAVAVNLSVKGMAFNMKAISVPAGAQVTVAFRNDDSGVPHNFAVYTDSSARQKIFVGPPITGPSGTTYTFTAPSSPGSYFFRCDIHPSVMTGTFTVTRS